MGPFDHRAFQDRLKAASGGEWFDFEGLIRDIYVAILKPGDQALDLGTNRGDHFFQIARAVAPGGKVIGFEAAPAMANELRALMADGYAHIDEVFELHEIAVSNAPGEAQFFFSAERTGLSSLLQRGLPETVPIAVKVDTLDNLLAGRGPFRFMKVDIEGAEYLAFLGGLATIKASMPLIAFEFDKLFFPHPPAKMVELLHSLGYRMYDFFGHEIVDGDDLVVSEFWNYLAFPEGSPDLATAVGVVRESLARQGIVIPKA